MKPLYFTHSLGTRASKRVYRMKRRWFHFSSYFFLAPVVHFLLSKNIGFFARIALSQDLDEFIEMCSFDGKDCDIQRWAEAYFHIQHPVTEISNCTLIQNSEIAIRSIMTAQETCRVPDQVRCTVSNIRCKRIKITSCRYQSSVVRKLI